MAKLHHILLILLLPVAGSSQTIIQGVVRSQHDNEPLPFCTIMISGTQIGAMADGEGKYKLVVSQLPPQGTLEVVYLGRKQTFPISIQKDQVLSFDIEFDEDPPGPCIEDVIIYERAFTPAMDQLKPAVLMRNDNSSVEQAMNLVPGVKFESRGAGGSKRLAIRGGFLRSPFGVRDVKVYFAGAPLTSPDGSTPLELVDVQGIGSAEVKKGPFSSEYGAVSNGVILFEPAYAHHLGRWGGRFDQTIGSYGYLRSALTLSQHHTAGGYAVHYIHQVQDGYRDLESNAKDFLQANGYLNVDKHRFFLHGLLYQGNWGLPGALDSAQVAENPRQALPYSLAANAHVERRHLRVGTGHRFATSRFNTASQVYLHLSDKENPYGTSPFFEGYKFENSVGAGGRTNAFLVLTDGLWAYAGAEYQTERLDFKEFHNVKGSPVGRKNISIIQSTQSHAYIGLRQAFRIHKFEENLSLNQIGYDQQVKWSAAELPDGKTAFKPAVAASAQYGFNPYTTNHTSFFLRLATGYSPPALWELMDSTGGFNADLLPETGLNTEVRVVQPIIVNDWKMEGALNAYHHLLYNAIVPLTISTGQVIYENQGGARQIGLEAQFALAKAFARSRLMRKFSLVANGTLQDFRFRDYRLDGEDLQGKHIPGAPLFTANLQADVEMRWKTLLQLTSNLVGKNYLNNENAIFQPSYLLLNVKLSQTIGLLESPADQSMHRIVIVPYFGINNLMNTAYTNFPQLNAANGKYWNPSPGMNWFGGVDVRF